ncbi:hypothetical protein D1872_320050 [compost metagenome]
MQLFTHGVDTYTLGADRCSDRIDIGCHGREGDFGTLSGNTCSCMHEDQFIFDLWYLQLEKTLEKLGRSA